jgi:hypothetical protein
VAEIWKEIDGYIGKYEVSNLGRVRSLNYKRSGMPREMMPSKTKKGYYMVALCQNGKRKMYKVARLVAVAFVANEYGLPEVNHKDEDKTNDRADNLEWCDRSYNNNYGSRIIRAAEAHRKPILQYTNDGKLVARWEGAKEAEKALGISDGNIWLCCNQKRKSAGGFIWRYEGCDVI